MRDIIITLEGSSPEETYTFTLFKDRIETDNYAEYDLGSTPVTVTKITVQYGFKQ